MASLSRVTGAPKATLLLAAVLISCERQPPRGQRSGDSLMVSSAPPLQASRRVPWDRALGETIATMSGEAGTPLLFMRDTLRLGPVDVELFSHDSQVVHSAFQVEGRTRGCAWQRTAQLTPLSDAIKPTPWSLALSPGIGRPIAVEAIGDLAARDSSVFAVQVRRVAGSLPDDSSSMRFRGLPIVVRDAWRLRLADGALVAVAVTTRSTNVESNAQVDKATIVAERDPRTSGDWDSAWTIRDTGPEERIEGTVLLAALQLRDGHAVLVFLREGELGMQLEFIERISPGVWRLRWSSALLSCPLPPS